MSVDNEMALVFEVSKGCQLSCAGCKVNKESSGIPDDSVLMDLLGLLYDLQSKGVEFAEIEFGPTDMMTAVNRDEVFSHPLISSIAQLFKTTVINAAFIHPKKEEYERLAKQVNSMSGKPVGLVTPIEINHVFNDKYISKISDNIKYFQDQLDHGFTELIFNIIYDRNVINSMGKRFSYEELFARARDISIVDNTAIDFAFHHGRENLQSPFIRQELFESITALNKNYIADLAQRQEIEKRHIPSHLLFDKEIKEIVFIDSALYVRPILSERILLLDDSLRISGDWTAENVLKNFEERVQNNEQLAQVINDCKGCSYVKRCSNRFVQQLMKVLDTDKCVTLLKDCDGLLSRNKSISE